MEYKALYRQWRPQRFSEVVGQKSTVSGLLNAVREGRLAHAYLFSGPRGTGKTSVAKIMARAVNCSQPEAGEPCGQCPACKEITSGAFMDVIEIDAASNRGIDEIRDLRENVKYLPAQGKKKVYIIDEVHMLTPEAFNALLKTLEEPPPSVMFILATTEQQKIPATVLSRCQRYAFGRLSIQEITDHLSDVAVRSGLVLEQAASEILARRANGGLRDALSMMEQVAAYTGSERIGTDQVNDVLGLVDVDSLVELLSAAFENRLADVVSLLQTILARGKEPILVARDSALCCRDLMMFRVLGTSAPLQILSEDTLHALEAAAGPLPVEGIARSVRHLLRLADELRYNDSQRFLLEVGLLEFTRLIEDSTSLQPAEAVAVRPQAQPKPPKMPSSVPKPAPREVLAETPKPPIPAAGAATPDKVEKSADGPWKEILDRVKTAKVTTHALLVPASFQGIDNGFLTLGYRPEYTFHRDKMDEKSNRSLLRTAIKEVTGLELDLRFVLLEDKAVVPEIVKKAAEIFGEENIEIIE